MGRGGGWVCGLQWTAGIVYGLWWVAMMVCGSWWLLGSWVAVGGWQASYSLSPICGFEWSMAMDWCLPIWLCLLGFDML